MNILIISDQFSNIDSAGINEPLNFINWNDGEIGRSLNEFHIIIVDLSFPQSRTNLNSIKDRYKDMENKLNKELINNDGLILLVVCGYEHKELFFIEENEKRFTYQFLQKIDKETYEKFEFVPNGENFTTPTNPYFKGYFCNVKHFYLTINHDPLYENIVPISKTTGVGNVCTAFTKKSGNGFIILLPGYDLSKKEDSFKSLLKICRIYFEKQQNIIYEKEKAESESFVPEWVHKYKVDRHKNIPDEILNLEDEEKCFDRICFLLYGKDIGLEDEVKFVFEKLGMNVKKSEEGESIDLICTYKDITFYIEITGSNHSINIENKKIGQTIDFKSKNPNEKVILLANTFSNLDLEERVAKNNFTEKVINALNHNDILMLTTFDLYFLWKRVFDKCMTNEEIIKLIVEAKGEFQCPQDILPNELRKKEVL
ncbi:MAG: hypothetical protein HY934_10995 [Candidatus Firestonebacteria bacterium]|nr:hypothetical protein [Candidatus Firestonebacteria bacterium]